MKLKKSMFNIDLQKDNGECLLFNTKECSFVVLDEENKRIFERDYIDLEDEEYNNPIINELHSMGFLVPDTLNEIELIKFNMNKNKFDNDTLALTICVTLDCNMNCFYCFEEKDRSYMSSDIQKHILRYVQTTLKKNKHSKLHITWTGGEPLMLISAIESMSMKFIELCDTLNIIYHASLVTNGLLLDSTYETLSQCKISDIQVTIDGLNNTHNKRRKTIDNSDGFSTIISNLKKIENDFFISIRINLDRHNYLEANELIDYLNTNLNSNNIRINVEKVKYIDDEFKTEELKDIYLNLFDALVTESRVKHYYPMPHKTACGAQCIDSLIIDPHGNLYKCFEEVGRKECIIGTIKEPRKITQREIDYMNMGLPDECSKCEYLPLCLGGCPYERFHNDNKGLCSVRALTTKEYLLKYYEYWQSQETA